MARYEDYTQNNTLPTVSFIAGTDYTIEYTLKNQEGNYINVNAYSLKILLSPYGQPEYTILQISATTSGSTKFIANFADTDTLGLGGHYLQQAELTDIAGKKTRAGQGEVIILKAIPSI